MVASACTSVKLGRYASEFLGTMFLVGTVKMAAALNGEYAAFAIGFVLMIAIFQFGYVSGGFYNPAVLIAVLVQGGTPNLLDGTRFDILQITFYFVSEFLGALVGAGLGTIVAGGAACDVVPAVGSGFDAGQAFMAELFFTFVLCSAVMTTGLGQVGNQFYGMAIGLSVFVGALSIGSVSGGCMNPAVYFGTVVTSSMCEDPPSSDVTGDFWIYFTAGPLAGVLAGLVYKFIIDPTRKAGTIQSIPLEERE